MQRLLRTMDRLACLVLLANTFAGVQAVHLPWGPRQVLLITEKLAWYFEVDSRRSMTTTPTVSLPRWYVLTLSKVSRQTSYFVMSQFGPYNTYIMEANLETR